MKYLPLVILLAACVPSQDEELRKRAAAEQDFANHQFHLQQAYEKGYDPEYVDDCYYYEELVCEFE